MASIHPLLTPYIPTESDPFDEVKAAHLLNRAGFGGTLEEIEKVRNPGPPAGGGMADGFSRCAGGGGRGEEQFAGFEFHRGVAGRFPGGLSGNCGANRRRRNARFCSS